MQVETQCCKNNVHPVVIRIVKLWLLWWLGSVTWHMQMEFWRGGAGLPRKRVWGNALWKCELGWTGSELCLVTNFNSSMPHWGLNYYWCPGQSNVKFKLLKNAFTEYGSLRVVMCEELKTVHCSGAGAEFLMLRVKICGWLPDCYIIHWCLSCQPFVNNISCKFTRVFVMQKPKLFAPCQRYFDLWCVNRWMFKQ